MDRTLYTTLVLKLKGEELPADADPKLLAELSKTYGIRKRQGTMWDEIYKQRGGKVITPKDEETKTILMCHRLKNKCLSVADTALNLSSKYEVTPDAYGISLSLISSVINGCPFCCVKNFETEKPVLVRWSNGMLYKAYVLSRDGRLCYIELDNYSTAVLDIKDVFDEFEHEITCSTCQRGVSDPPNEIVLCDCCNVGYHQKCHTPPITNTMLHDDTEWFCTNCIDTSNGGDLKPFSRRPEYNLSTLACMAILDKGPCSRPAILSWIQEHFKHYKDTKSDRWKARLSSTMSTSRHWLKLDKTTGFWDFCQHNLPTVLRHLSEVTKERGDPPSSLLSSNHSTVSRSRDLPSSLRGKIPASGENQAIVSTSFSDVLPYDVYSLTWDSKHQSNEEGVYCYCMGSGVWYKQMLQCISCLQWFHQACVTTLTKPLLCGERHVFVCSVCNLGEEHFTTVPLCQTDILHLIMYHTVITKYKGDFSLPICLKMHVLPIIEQQEYAVFSNTQNKLVELAKIAKKCSYLFEMGAKNKNTTLYKLKVQEPPTVLLDTTLRPPLAPSLQGNPLFLPPGFVVDLSNNTSGLQVDGSPPPEDYPPSQYDLNSLQIFQNVKQILPGMQPDSKRKARRRKHRDLAISPTKENKTKSKKTGADNKNTKSPSKNRSRKSEPATPTEPRPKRCKAEQTENQAPETLNHRNAIDPNFKSSMVMKRLQSGEKYRIMGKRIAPSGKIEYLIGWEGLHIDDERMHMNDIELIN